MKYFICKRAQDKTCRKHDSCFESIPSHVHWGYGKKCKRFISIPCDWHGKSMEQMRNKITEILRTSESQIDKAICAERYDSLPFLYAMDWIRFADWLAGKENT